MAIKEKSVEEIKAEIKLKKGSDKRKLIGLAKVAGGCLILRAILYIVSPQLTGLLTSALWFPLGILILAFPFYAFEKLLDRIKPD
ncbi:hypothetical protein BXY85_1545 [Roseivirga pacifica]|uniref:Uncharacterized protein n=1 Tax=Roseivirga pacifica TaxID=1267423 RepID=A0A1I0MNT4_9BACT|nr:hypothetical protein [Roseivirga pacifica]RKQ50529.1 hypothetical protein BXY85_1545 [Roseivirga pacifica]SEV89526.1 hypothetical protein SAMN05216290_0529 [Roseivirga pacifica]